MSGSSDFCLGVSRLTLQLFRGEIGYGQEPVLSGVSGPKFDTKVDAGLVSRSR